MADPFTSAYTALCDALTGSSYVTAIVDADNIVTMNTLRPPGLDYRAFGDTPTLFVTPRTGGDADDAWHISTTARALLPVDLDVWTADERLAEVLWPLRFAILRALYAATPTLGSSYVQRADPSAGWAPLEPGDATLRYDTESGWGARMTVTLELRIPHTELA